MKRADLDVVVTGRYRVTDKGVELIMYAVDRDGTLRVAGFSFPLADKYVPLLSRIVRAPEEPTKVVLSTCRVTLKTVPAEPRRQEKATVILDESGGNVIVENILKRVDFNILSPVDVKVTIDDQAVPVSDSEDATLTLPNGSHRVTVSFKRGYFSNESLLYTSSQEVRREALLDLSKSNNLVVEVRLDPLFTAQPVGLEVYRRADTERYLIVPISRLRERERIDVFKD